MSVALSWIAAAQADPLRAGLALAVACAIAWAVGRSLGGGASASLAVSAPSKPAATYSRAQVAVHASKEDLWVVIGRKVREMEWGVECKGGNWGEKRRPTLNLAR